MCPIPRSLKMAMQSAAFLQLTLTIIAIISRTDFLVLEIVYGLKQAKSLSLRTMELLHVRTRCILYVYQPTEPLSSQIQ